ncbi:MAG: orotidine-5'-phosphate decarboxylase [Gammaproteobacteria bacterium]|nr:orotidine-5'-phosphate decarboxylase [Gammaproteobacteria bacterium]
MKIIVALDYTNPLEALEMCAKLRDVADGFKINHALWSQSVYIKDYTQAGELFVDCKLWDTPNTVKQVVQKIVDKGATMTTICTHNNEAVFEELEQFSKQVKLLGVTYLTSWSGSDLLDILHYLPKGADVMWRENIERVRKHGFAGMVCSPKDLPVVLPLTQGMIRVCPGIGTNKGQIRTVSPKQATNLGADYLVIGRTITQSDDPVQALIDIRQGI